VVGVGTVDGGGNVEVGVGNLHDIGVEFVVCSVDLVGGWKCVMVVVVGNKVVVVVVGNTVVVVVVGNMVVVVVVGNIVVLVVVGNIVVVVVVGNMAVASGDRPNRTGQTQSFLDLYLLYTNPHIPLSASLRWVPPEIVEHSGHALSTFYGTPLQMPSNFGHTTGG
jgi:hypothetical protein